MSNEANQLPPEDRLQSLTIQPVTEPHTDPEKLIPEEVERRRGIFQKLGWVTKESHLPFSDAERPIRQRAWRAEEYHRLFVEGRSIKDRIGMLLGKQSVRPTLDDRKEMIEEGVAPLGFDRDTRNASVQEKVQREEVLREYLKQGSIDLEFEDLGKMAARYVIMTPPPEKLQKDQPTIVFVPWLINAAASVAQIVDRLALSGRKVVVLPQPESAVGGVNEQFAEAVRTSEDFTPHARYFRALIDGLAKEQAPELQEKMELWALSAGCPEMARALTDPEFSKRVESAVFIAPASSADVPNVERRAIVDFVRMAARFTPKAPIVWGKKDPETTEENALRSKVRDFVSKHLSKRTDLWERMRVGDGKPGRVTVVTYDRDYVTDCAKGFSAKKPMPNPQMRVLPLKGKHQTPGTSEGAEELLKEVLWARTK